jgi:hypothetical protein
MPSRSQREIFREFLDWGRFHGLDMPIKANEVAAYLLEMMVDGASLADIKRAGAAISTCYNAHGCYLDARPIKGALAMAQAQLDPNRTLN